MNYLAQKFTNPVVGDTLKSLEKGESDQFLTTFLPKGISLLLIVGSLGFFFMLVWGAVTWILSGGDKAGVESAKNKITSALIGFVVLMATFAIIGLIETFFNIKILSIDIAPLFIR